ncbi:MAG: PadR family transcriptional regulator [Spirochaetales bacterium]|nr:PadR family transcriptional regulator [Spirochaetales bacterium]
MAKENKSKYALLGLLNFVPLSGYDIKKWTDNSLRFFWSENYGHIYPLLKELEKAELVTRQKVDSEKGPSKNVFTITQKGTKEFLAWLKQNENPETYRIEILLKLFFSSKLALNEIIVKLENHIHQQEQLLSEYKEVENGFDHIKDKRIRLSAEMTMSYGFMHAEMNINWARDTIAKIKTFR